MLRGLRRLRVALAAGALAACPGERAPQKEVASPDRIIVHQDTQTRETSYTISSGDCRMTWVVYQTDLNRGVIRHRPDCGLPFAEQALLIGKLLVKVMASDEAAGDFRTLSWGRMYPDGARDATMAARLASAAKRSKEWDAAKGRPTGGDANGWVRNLANEAAIYRELEEVFHRSGLDIRLSGVEKVLVLEAGRLPFIEELRAEGVQAGDRVPFDCQAWFSVKRMEPAQRGAKARP